eukprot:m.718162 g.718162  ORF g.718162 m.718162 type:complete len:802 (+) comp22992_c1_seq8:41-2446(+)
MIIMAVPSSALDTIDDDFRSVNAGDCDTASCGWGLHSRFPPHILGLNKEEWATYRKKDCARYGRLSTQQEQSLRQRRIHAQQHSGKQRAQKFADLKHLAIHATPVVTTSIKDVRRSRREENSHKKQQSAITASTRREHNRILASKSAVRNSCGMAHSPTDEPHSASAETSTRLSATEPVQDSATRRLYLYNPECHYATPLLGSTRGSDAVQGASDNSGSKEHSHDNDDAFGESERQLVPLHPDFDPKNYTTLLATKIKHLTTLFADYVTAQPTTQALGTSPKCTLDVYPSEPLHFRLRCRFGVCRDAATGHIVGYQAGKGSPCIQSFPIASLRINALMPALLRELQRSPALARGLYQVNFLTTLNTTDAVVTLVYAHGEHANEHTWRAAAREVRHTLSGIAHNTDEGDPLGDNGASRDVSTASDGTTCGTSQQGGTDTRSEGVTDHTPCVQLLARARGGVAWAEATDVVHEVLRLEPIDTDTRTHVTPSHRVSNLPTVLSYVQAAGSFSNPNGGVNTKTIEWLRQCCVEMLHGANDSGRHNGGDTESVDPTTDAQVPRHAIHQGRATRGLMELYCGCGNHTVALSPLFDHAVALELNARLAHLACVNLENNADPGPSTPTGTARSHPASTDNARDENASALHASTESTPTGSIFADGASTRTGSVDCTATRHPEASVSNTLVVCCASEDFARQLVHQGRTTVDVMRARGPPHSAVLAKNDYSVLLLDPPRAGLDDVTTTLASQFADVLLISCNQHTLRHTLTVLSTTHRVRRFAFFDHFPYTSHTECGVWLQAFEKEAPVI